MKKKLRTLLFILCAVFITGLIILLYGYFNFRDLTVTKYQVELNVKEPIRIVHLSDLHNAEFGDKNSELIELVEDQQPDLIFMSGDMLTRGDENSEVVLRLISDLSKTAPVYFGYGNHEYNWEQITKIDLRDKLEKAGAVVVDNNYVDISFKGTELRIGGYMGYYRQPHMYNKTKDQIQAEIEFADDFENTYRVKLLINHVPTGWLDWHYINKYPVDLVFSGHYHGGVIRIPFMNQGLFAPYVGWFPPYTKGLFEGELARCILSAGLGAEHRVPRIFNPPEVVVADILPEN